MYSRLMKTITITIPEDLDAAAAAEAVRRGISKSELIRVGLAALIPDRPDRSAADPWYALAGFGETGVCTEPGEIDRVVYGA